jgi:flagellar basal-body rod modification protein FlgD
MSIAAVNTTYTDSTQTYESSASSISVDDFYTLLTAELQNQDPTDPIDTTELIQQTVSYTQLERLDTISNNIETMLLYQQSINNSSAVSFIGKTVTANNDQLSISEGSTGDITFELAEDASDVTVSIYNSDGELVRVIDGGALSEGEHTLEWDACDNDGNELTDGTYTFAVSAVDESGEAVTSTTLTTAVVSGISYEDGIAYLELGNFSVPLGSVIEIYDS